MSATTRWRLLPHDPGQVQALSQGAGVSSIVALLLINRGVTEPSRARAFLEAKLNHLEDPENLPGAPEAADRINRAVRSGRGIIVYGDYDVDGVCGTSVLWSCLKLAGAKDPTYYIPHRVTEGYGVNGKALQRIAKERPGSLVVTVDCGVSAVEEARLARELGLEFIVTDHHTIGPDLPEADVIVHPRLPGGSTASPDLCGAGVAFKVAWQVAKSFGDGKKASPHLRNFLLESLGLVAMATVADLVPLTGENRVIVRHGLAGIDSRPTEGLRALLEVSGATGRRKLSAGTVAFNLAPRINAAGRLERATRAVEMLTTGDTVLAREIAGELDRANAQRQEIEATIVKEAHEMIRATGGLGDRGAVVVGSERWHPGVVGIVASRLVETYHRPAVVVALNEALSQGSARSVNGFDLYEAIKACSAGLLGFGGHAAAAGVKMTGGYFPEFASRFDEHCRAMLTAEQRQKALKIDAEVPLGVLTTRVVEEIESLEPYGMGNPRPILVANNVKVVADPRVVGDKKVHVQLRFGQGDMVVKAVGWNMAERCRILGPGSQCSIAFHVSINEWNGRREVQLELKDFKLPGSD